MGIEHPRVNKIYRSDEWPGKSLKKSKLKVINLIERNNSLGSNKLINGCDEMNQISMRFGTKIISLIFLTT